LILIRLSASTGFFNQFSNILHEILTGPFLSFETQINGDNTAVKRATVLSHSFPVINTGVLHLADESRT